MHTALNNLRTRSESHRLTLRERFSTCTTTDESSPDEKSGVVQEEGTLHSGQAHMFFPRSCFWVGCSIGPIHRGSCYIM